MELEEGGGQITTAIAIDGDKNSQYAIKWAVDNIFDEKFPKCILVHVLCKTVNLQDIDFVPKEGRPPTQQELKQLFLPYKKFCERNGVETHELVIHDIDVPSALNNFIIDNSISNIVLGASNRNALTRKFKNANVPSSLLKSAPESCMVYVISSRGKVQTTRKSSQPPTPKSISTTPRAPHSNVTTPRRPETPVTARSDGLTPAPQQANSVFSPFFRPPSSGSDRMSMTSFSQASWRTVSSDRISCDRISDVQLTPNHNMSSFCHRIPSMDSLSSNASNRNSDSSEISGPPTYQSTDVSENLEVSTGSASSRSSNSSQNHEALDAEMRRLKLELEQSMAMYNSACKEADLANRMANELQQLSLTEEHKLEEAAWSLAEMEKQRTRAAIEAMEVARKRAEMEIQMRRKAEIKAKQIEERKKAMGVCNNIIIEQYRRFSIEEIQTATDHFSCHNKIGEGSYGPVYQGMIGHTPVAIKVLRPDMSQGERQFRQEVELLSSMRHPHMVILLGACPEYGCIVYEHMESGSLEDHLFRKKKTPPISWRARFRIASEIASGLLFLHETKPEPIVHRDMKPGNILLNHYLVSKIADVGLARLVPQSAADSVTCVTAAAGTFCYIDPEYQRTGMLTVKSDLYSFGVLLLQLITARPPMGLALQVEEAMDNGTFSDILDPILTDWPVEEALSLAKVALKCCELRKRDRPDLASVVLPELNRLRDIAPVGEQQPEDILLSCSPNTSVPGESHNKMHQMTTTMNMKKGWQRQMKYVNRFRSFRSGGNSRSSKKLRFRPAAKSISLKPSFGCLTEYMTCSNSASNPPMERNKSFT